LVAEAAGVPDRRRALELLASSRDGCTEALMLAHGFTVELLVDLCIAELAIASPERRGDARGCDGGLREELAAGGIGPLAIGEAADGVQRDSGRLRLLAAAPSALLDDVGLVVLLAIWSSDPKYRLMRNHREAACSC
jgi:hypothetical protein